MRSDGTPSGDAGTSEIFCTTSMPSSTRPKIVYLPSSEGWSVTQTKNWAPPLSGPIRLQHGRDRSARRVLGAELGRQHAKAARPIELRFRRILRQRIAALDDGEPDHAVEDRAVEGSLPGELDEVADVIRRKIRTQADDELAGGRRHDCLLSRHLRQRQRRLERPCRSGRCLGPALCRRACEEHGEQRQQEEGAHGRDYRTAAVRPAAPAFVAGAVRGDTAAAIDGSTGESSRTKSPSMTASGVPSR